MNNKKVYFIFIIALIVINIACLQGLNIIPSATLTSDYHSPFDLAYSPDGSLIAVSDRTKAQLEIIDTATSEVSKTISLNGEPKGLAWSGNDIVYVAEYDAGTVAEIDAVEGCVLRRFETGPKAYSVAVASNLLSVSDFGLNKVSIVDLTVGEIIGEVETKNYPSFLDTSVDGRYAIVGHSNPTGESTHAGYASSISFVDLSLKKVTNEIALPAGSNNVREIICSNDGKWAYVVHTLGRVTLPTTQVTKGWINTDALSIIDIDNKSLYTTVLLDTLYEGAADPWGLAISADDNTLWISIAGTHKVFRLDLYGLHELLKGNIPGADSKQIPTLTFRSKANYDKPYSDIWFAIRSDPGKRDLLKNNLGALWSAGLLTKINLPGQGPRGISISDDDTRVAVGAYFSGEVYYIDTSSNKVVGSTSLGVQPEENSVRRGERIFHDASTTTQSWLSCATCHFEGRADGHSWDETNEGTGNRKNTKSLLGAFDTLPSMWHGLGNDINEDIAGSFRSLKFKVPTQQEVEDVAAYVRSLSEEKSPYANPDGTMTPDAIAGKAIFESSETNCASCHSGPYLTDNKAYDVGTKDQYDKHGVYDTPQLIELWRTAPYLHDGSATTIRDVLTVKNMSDEHGKTSHLTEKEIDQLEAYLLQVGAKIVPTEPINADLNDDGKVNVGDLGVVSHNYGYKEGDEGWENAAKADVNRDKKVGLADLIEVAMRILGF